MSGGNGEMTSPLMESLLRTRDGLRPVVEQVQADIKAEFERLIEVHYGVKKGSWVIWTLPRSHAPQRRCRIESFEDFGCRPSRPSLQATWDGDGKVYFVPASQWVPEKAG